MAEMTRGELESIIRRSSPGVGTVVAGLFVYDLLEFFLSIIAQALR